MVSEIKDLTVSCPSTDRSPASAVVLRPVPPPRREAAYRFAPRLPRRLRRQRTHIPVRVLVRPAAFDNRHLLFI